MVKIKSYPIAILIMLMAIAGCVDSGNGPVNEQELRKGTGGVEISFTDNAPPDSVLEETPFKIGALLFNRGASQADVHLTLSVEEDYIDISENKKVVSVTGKTLSSPEKKKKKLYFDATSKQIGAQKNKHPTTIILTACYVYKTIFSNQICINPHQYSPSEEDVCTESYEKFNSQGGPVAVTKIETRMENKDNKVQPVIIIHVEHKGKGTLLKGSSAEKACTQDAMERQDINVVQLSGFYLGNKEYKAGQGDILCDSQVKLIDGKGKFTCRVKDTIDTNSPAYHAQARAILQYGYSKSTSKNVDVERNI